MPSEIVKAPSSVLDVGIDWSKWLNSGDRIIASDWQCPTGGITFTSSTYNNTTTKVLVGGGVLGKQEVIINKITTNAGLVDERSILISIRQRTL